MTDPTVVLVSVGADSAALIDEIERKGLRVVPCPFAEAEETIEREKPLLVVLHGSRGAVELSTLLEDAQNPPQVAVVAARAELGTLMGLNRDIVVSLLATELTEKTVAARLEAVVRQRAKALGLSLNLAARRMSLGPRPSLPRPAPPRPAQEAKPQNLVLDAPTPDLHAAGRQKPAEPPASAGGTASGTAIGLPAPGRPDPGPPPRRPPPRDPAPLDAESMLSASLLLSDIPEPDAPRAGPKGAPPPRPGPPRPAPPRPAMGGVDETIESDAPTAVVSLSPSVIESLESLEPRRPGVAPVAIAPGAPPVPRFDPSELLSESGLDESVGPELKQALSPGPPPTKAVAPAPAIATPDPIHEPPLPITEPFAKAVDAEEDDFALPLLRPSRPPEPPAEDFSTGMLTEVTMPAIPGSLAAEALAEARLRSEPSHPIPEPPPLLSDAEEDRATVTKVVPSAFPALPPEARLDRPSPVAPRETKRSRAGLTSGLAVVAVLAGAAAYVQWGMPKAARPPEVTKEPEPVVAAASPPPTPEPALSAEPLASASAQPSADTPAPAASGDPAADGAASAAEEPTSAAVAEPASAAEAAPAQPEAAPPSAPSVESTATAAPVSAAASTEPAVLLDNPFATPDADLPGCDKLAPGAQPTSPDPVTEASGHWNAARKSIVKGDIEGASRSMCLAVAINPQSPAVEGLARLFTLAHSSAQALIWVEKAILLAPTNRELLNLRGDAKSQLGRQDEATMDWLQAMGIGPDETKRRTSQSAEYANVARTEKGRGDLAKAEQFFRRALGFEETNLPALTGLAEVLLARKLYDQAGTFAVRALAVFEPVPEAYLVLGDIAVAKNDPARARASFERALAIRPDFWPAKTRLRDLSK